MPTAADASETTSLSTDLASLLNTIQRPGDFFVAGTTMFLPPLLEVTGIGPIALPLLPVQAEQLIAGAQAAPFGRGEQTIIDPAVRNCRQISADRVRLSGRHWMGVMDTILTRVASGFGISDPISAEFYKLLIYDCGSFFVDHRDTEKVPGMFATLVVVLPGAFTGGALVVRHKGREAHLPLHSEDPAEIAFAAFYADCVHEILPITDGCRLTLTYNLIRNGKGQAPKAPDYDAEQTRIAALLQSWRTDKPRDEESAPEKLVYLLDHAYTPAELDFSTLKGRDVAVASLLTSVAKQTDHDLHLALLTIEESGAAEYAETYGYRRRRWDDEGTFEAGEVFERSVTLSDWRAPNCPMPALGTIPVEKNEFSPPNACDELAPDEEHFHEATGNEGASFERTYRRAALVLWQRERTFTVLSQGGLSVTLPYLDNLVQRWNANHTAQDTLRHEALELATHMLARWPQQLSWYSRHDKGPGHETRMLALLTRLDDRNMIEQFLTEVPTNGVYERESNQTIIAALERLPTTRRVQLIENIVAGTATMLFGACADLLARAADAWPPRAGTLVKAATQLVDKLPSAPTRTTYETADKADGTVHTDFVVNLLTGLDAIEPTLAQRAVLHFFAWPKTYGMDAILVPAIRKLAESDIIHNAPALQYLRDACLAHLQSRIAEPLEPPKDQRRSNVLPCNCSRCAELAGFLDDPERARWVCKAAEAIRSHVEETIKRAKSDVNTETERKGSPHSLVCTKNQASYERRKKQRLRDLEDVKRITQAGNAQCLVSAIATTPQT